ncbi:hypothetical protein [Pisciglobus halotolerans]|uniref:Uncharacterized protein n=1 Tax=Pisciglobus halotolerans TaxID=745365 RepID=A0A1I3BIT9_9LACT|nr:hypothetical protein [Pisciglobus halotolerans]SFH62197.1 hypothetical protein SAMN04489868_1076 [Pisciglobus halotolerans]
METKSYPLISEYENGYKLTDEFGDSFVVERYDHAYTNEKRVQIYWEPKNEVHDNYLIDKDIQVDLPEEVFEAFCINYGSRGGSK